MRITVWGMTISCLIFLAGCDTVPSLEKATGGIPIRDIVMRVKCELAESFDQKIQDPHFRWIADWTAKVDLTLQADTQGGVSPAGAYIEPFQPVASVGKAFYPSFTLGGGANYGEKATRTEMISFSLSLKELKAWRRAQRAVCAPEGRELAGDLGLKEWIDAALEPVAYGDLKAGDHPAPASAKAGGKVSPKGGAKAMGVRETYKKQAENALKQAKKDAADAKASAKAAKTSAHNAASAVRDAQAPYSSVLEDSYRRQSTAYVKAAHDQAAGAGKLADLAAKKIEEAQSVFDRMTNNDSSDDASRLKKVQDLASEVSNAAVRAKSLATAAKDNYKLAQKRTPNAPIDSISHSVQFVVSYGASVAPSWSLVHFKGPSGNLAAVNGQRTHTLNIALGPRGDRTVSAEAVRALNTLTIQQSRPAQ